jgi:hypothetical protein
MAPNEQSRLRRLINITHKHGIEQGRKVAEALHVKQALEKLNAERRAQLKRLEHKDAPGQYTMYDTITISAIPSNPTAVAGYVGGHWPTYKDLVKWFPRAKHLSIAVNADEDADCLDIETGDATPQQAAEWVLRQKRLGKKLIVLYFSVSNKGAVEASLSRANIRRSLVKFWGAHYTFSPHIEPGFDATQWTDKALGATSTLACAQASSSSPDGDGTGYGACSDTGIS